VPPTPAVDHLVVATTDLADGVPALAEQLGVPLADPDWLDFLFDEDWPPKDGDRRE
jgi:hypothetical protein